MIPPRTLQRLDAIIRDEAAKEGVRVVETELGCIDLHPDLDAYRFRVMAIGTGVIERDLAESEPDTGDFEMLVRRKVQRAADEVKSP